MGRDRPWAFGLGRVWLGLVSGLGASLLGSQGAIGQITPAPDGLGTEVRIEGDRLDITGGTEIGGNLFHGFDRFNVQSGQTATFWTGPAVRNVLGRITGGEVSHIDGLLRLTGSTANLYLINPAGLIFGAGARLDLPGSFTATTATAVGFGSGAWLPTAGPIDVASLRSALAGSAATPVAFRFGPTAAAIANFGNLAVAPGATLNLLAGAIFNAGQLSAPGGQVTLAAVPQAGTLRLSSAGMVLSFDLEPAAIANPGTLADQPLAALLTGAGVPEATTAAIDASGRVVLLAGGQVSTLNESGQVSGPGSGPANERANESRSNSTGSPGGQVDLMGDRLVLRGATIATGPGSQVRLGGEAHGDTSWPRSQTVTIDRASQIIAGSASRVVVWSDRATDFAGRLDTPAGWAEISSAGALGFTGTVTVGSTGSLLLDPANIQIVADSTTDTSTADGLLAGSGAIGSAVPGSTLAVSATALSRVTGNILVEATDNITVSPGVSLSLAEDSSTSGTTGATGTVRSARFVADSDGNGIGSFTLPSGQTITAPGRSVEISGASVAIGDISTTSTTTAGGALTLRATAGDLTVGNLDSSSEFGSAGPITLSATGNVKVDSILASATGAGTTTAGSAPTGGAVSIAAGQAINTGLIFTGSSAGPAGPVTMTAGTGLTVGEISAIALGSDRGGDIRLQTSQGGLTLTGQLDSSSQTGLGGTIDLQAQGDIRLQTVRLGRGPGPTTGPTGETIAAAPNLLIDTPATVDLSTAQIIGQTTPVSIGSRRPPVDLKLPGILADSGLDATVKLAAAYTLSNDIDLKGGRLSLTTPGSLTIGRGIQTSGGTLSLTSTGGDLAVTETGAIAVGVGSLTLKGQTIAIAGPITADSLPTLAEPKPIGVGGNLTFLAQGNLTTANLSARGVTQGGAIALTSQQGSITTANVDVSATTGIAGKITITAIGGSLTTAQKDQLGAIVLPEDPSQTIGLPIPGDRFPGDIRTGTLTATGPTGGGTIGIAARTRLFSGPIDASSSQAQGGTVTLDPDYDLDLAWINAQGATTGGTVNLTAQRFIRLRDQFSDRTGLVTSLAASGGTGDGLIRLQHGGSEIAQPQAFTVGDSSINGATAALSTGGDRLLAPQRILGPLNQGRIQVVAGTIPDPPIDPTKPKPPITPVTPVPPVTPNPTADLPPGTTSLSLRLPPELQGDRQDNRLNETETTFRHGWGDLWQPIDQAQAEAQINRPANRPLPGLDSWAVPASPQELNRAFQSRETRFKEDYNSYLPTESKLALSIDEAQRVLQRIENTSGVKPALIYVSFQSNSTAGGDRDPLELLLVTGQGEPILLTIPGATRQAVLQQVNDLRVAVTSPVVRRTNRYQTYAQQFYRWLVQPLETVLADRQINNLTFVMDTGLRLLPVALLHDGKDFLLARYSLGLMPSLALTDTRYVNVAQAPVLAMGASEFKSLDPLPSVPIELEVIRQNRQSGREYINQNFTLDRLQSSRNAQATPIIHLATHAEFKPGKPNESFIQLWGDDRLPLDQIRNLGWNNPAVDLLVLSACRTAVGDRSAELGFAGLAVAAGVKTAIASLWYVSDTGTLGLMSEFYYHLGQTPIKAEALRQAQLSLARGETRVEGNELVGSFGRIPLPPAILEQGDLDLRSPYYWSAFSTIGSPW